MRQTSAYYLKKHNLSSLKESNCNTCPTWGDGSKLLPFQMRPSWSASIVPPLFLLCAKVPYCKSVTDCCPLVVKSSKHKLVPLGRSDLPHESMLSHKPRSCWMLRQPAVPWLRHPAGVPSLLLAPASSIQPRSRHYDRSFIFFPLLYNPQRSLGYWPFISLFGFSGTCASYKGPGRYSLKQQLFFL